MMNIIKKVIANILAMVMAIAWICGGANIYEVIEGKDKTLLVCS